MSRLGLLFFQFHYSYAIDWEPNHGRIRVMLGKSGKVVCTLKVDPMYSHGLGQVQLLAVEGSSDHRGIQQLQVRDDLLAHISKIYRRHGSSDRDLFGKKTAMNLPTTMDNSSERKTYLYF